MGGDVHAQGQAADDQRLAGRLAEGPDNPLAAGPAVEALVSGADDGHGGPPAEQLPGGGAAAHIEQQGGVRTFPERLRIAFVEDVEELDAARGKLLVFLLRGFERGGADAAGAGIIGPEQFEPLLLGEREHRLGGAKCIDQVVGKLRLIAEDGVERDGAHHGCRIFVHFS